MIYLFLEIGLLAYFRVTRSLYQKKGVNLSFLHYAKTSLLSSYCYSICSSLSRSKKTHRPILTDHVDFVDLSFDLIKKLSHNTKTYDTYKTLYITLTLHSRFSFPLFSLLSELFRATLVCNSVAFFCLSILNGLFPS